MSRTFQNGKMPDLARITPNLLARFDRPGPRYTSYPTAVEFHDGFGPSEYRDRLTHANRKPDAPLSLYVHIPFCKKKCTFCGCNSLVPGHPKVVEGYLDCLFAEIDMLARALPDRRTVMQYHWGGGTPTFLSASEMEALWDRVQQHFHIGDGAEVAIEVNPGVTSLDTLARLRKMGFNRVSFGVQDFDAEVLRAIGRDQTETDVTTLMKASRDLGFQSVNVDLIYGLPGQTTEKFQRTIDAMIELSPDRVALYSFAYIPRVMKNQSSMARETLPDRDLKFALFALAIRGFLEAGYLQIGMDHFALPSDEMGRAVSEGRLYRNFMGYTVHRATDMTGLGASSIGAVESAFVQNHRGISEYATAIGNGEFPTARGYALTADDRIRQKVITELMCNFHLDVRSVETEFCISFDDYFALEQEELVKTMVKTDPPFVVMDDESIDVTPLGRLFIRNICMVFDRHLRDGRRDKPLFSRTV